MFFTDTYQTVEVLIYVFELSVCSFELYNENFLATVLTSLPLTVNSNVAIVLFFNWRKEK